MHRALLPSGHESSHKTSDEIFRPADDNPSSYYCIKTHVQLTFHYMGTIKITHYQSPAGEMLLGTYGDRLCMCDWAIEKRRLTIDRRICRRLDAKYEYGSSYVIRQAIMELDEYFNGKRHDFSVPLMFTGTEFQCRVWTELNKIPYGTTITYGELARRIGNPNAVRAVASANASNPLSIFVPCHRVIGRDNKLTGYAGGLAAKQLLLEIEAQTAGRC